MNDMRVRRNHDVGQVSCDSALLFSAMNMHYRKILNSQ